MIRRSGLPIRSVRNHLVKSRAISRLGLDLDRLLNHADALSFEATRENRSPPDFIKPRWRC